jgi:hypothetical protein
MAKDTVAISKEGAKNTILVQEKKRVCMWGRGCRIGVSTSAVLHIGYSNKRFTNQLNCR